MMFLWHTCPCVSEALLQVAVDCTIFSQLATTCWGCPFTLYKLLLRTFLPCWTPSFTNLRVTSAWRHIHCCCLKANKVSKSEGTSEVEKMRHFWKYSDAICQKLSKLVHVSRNYSLPKLAHFFVRQCIVINCRLWSTDILCLCWLAL